MTLGKEGHYILNLSMSLGTEKPEVFLDFAGKVACLCVCLSYFGTLI